MNISEFARSRGIEPQTVRHYVNDHEDIKKHTKKVGKTVELSDEAIELLDKIYPLPRPVQLVNGVDPDEHKAVQDKLTAAQEFIIKLQNKMMEDQKLLAQAEAQKILLEDRESQLKIATEEGEKKDTEIVLQKKKIEEQNRQLEELKNENERLKNRSLFERIFNK